MELAGPLERTVFDGTARYFRSLRSLCASLFAEPRNKDARSIRSLWLDHRRVRFVIPNAKLIPIWPSTDSGCRIIERRDPPISTLAPRPTPRATLPLAPT